MFGLIKQMFLVLLSFAGSLARIVNTPNHIKCNPQYMTQPTLISLHPNEYIEV